MQAFYTSYMALAVSTIYILWRNYSSARMQHERTLRDRVTYMLWVMANQGD
jgi:hypothetical protein